MNELITMEVVVMVITGIIVILLMAAFGVRFTILHHKRRREVLMKQKSMNDAFQRELLQTQLETQNHTLQQISRELHDNIGQLLTVVVLQIDSIEAEITQPQIQQSLQQTGDLVRNIIIDVRSLSKTLDYDTVQRFGFLPSLTLELERIQQIGRIHTHLDTLGEIYSLGEQTEIVLLRMAQESINNALKYSGAQNLNILADYGSDKFVLTISDDGKGFDIEEVYARKLEKAGAGLNNLQRRTKLLGGICTIDSQLGQGTRIQIQLPRKITTSIDT